MTPYPFSLALLVVGCSAPLAPADRAPGADTRLVDGSFLDTDADVVIVENAPYDYNGAAATRVGDVTGDGIDDLLIGAPHDDDGVASGTGSVRVFAGPIAAGTLSAVDAVTRFVGTADYDYLGESITPLGDMNVDGVDDVALLVGDTLYVWYGPLPAGDLDVTTADASRLLVDGAPVAGDLNLDGYPDLVTATTTPGEVIVEYGPILGTEPVDTTIDQIFEGGYHPGSRCLGGHMVIDDLTGDGVADLIIADACADIGYGTAQGAAYVFAGPLVGSTTVPTELMTARLTFNGNTNYEALGRALSVGDIDGDGTPELALAGSGSVMVFPGDLAPGSYDTNSPTSVLIEGDAADGWGSTAVFVGDVDDSGSDALLLGAMGYVGTEGQAQLLYAPTGTVSVPDPWLGAQFDSSNTASTHFGDLVASVGDVNDDGYPDFLIGAFYEGQAYVWFGGVAEPVDFDQDGYDETVDCNDANAAVHPGAWEDPSTPIDDDCDGLINESELHLSSTSLQAGQSATFTVLGLAPLETVRVVASTGGLGLGPCPAAIGGQCLGVQSPKLLPATAADATGVAELTVTLPATLSGTLALQALVVRGVGGVDSLLSDPIEQPIAP